MKYIITESHFDNFFKRRFSRFDGIINYTFAELFSMYKCKENNISFKLFWSMVVNDVMEKARDVAHKNRESSEWENGTYYVDMLYIYLDIKEPHYEMKYNKLCNRP